MKIIITEIRRALMLCVGVSIIVCGAADQASAALLEGKQMAVTLLHRTEIGSEEIQVFSGITVGPGVELEGFGARENPDLPALVDIDVSDANILITLIIDQPLSFLERLLFTDPANNLPPIQNVTINPTTTWAGFEPDRLNFSTKVIGVDLGELSGRQGQQILLDVVPEPAAAGIALPAVAALAAARRGGAAQALGRSGGHAWPRGDEVSRRGAPDAEEDAEERIGSRPRTTVAALGSVSQAG